MKLNLVQEALNALEAYNMNHVFLVVIKCNLHTWTELCRTEGLDPAGGPISLLGKEVKIDSSLPFGVFEVYGDSRLT
jgi:hypothetical protein